MNKLKEHFEKQVPHNVKDSIKRYFFMIVASAISGVAINMFIAPSEFITGGITGLSTLLYVKFGWSMGLTQFLINVPIMILAFKQMGLRFVIDCFITLAVRGIVIDLFAFLPPFASDDLLASMYSGVLWGLAVGLHLKYKVSSGGTEILGRWLHSKIKVFSMPAVITFIDALVVISGTFILHNPTNMLYVIILMVISIYVSDIVLLGFNRAKTFSIITNKPEEVSNAIMSTVKRGVTKIDAIGMYTETQKALLIVCVRSKQVSLMKECVKNADEHAFLMIGDSSDAFGVGFSSIGEE